MTAASSVDLTFSLLNDWQRDFPLVAAPFMAIGERYGLAPCACGQAVLEPYRRLLQDGAISRIGGIWGTGAAGAALLCAMVVPTERLEAVAAMVSAHPGVNHNYEREHDFNLWFVITGCDADAVGRSVDQLESCTGCKALRLRMQRAYRIDLGFDMRNELAAGGRAAAQQVPAVDCADAPLAVLVEEGLPMALRPFDAWAQALQWPVGRVLATLQRWLQQGTMRRFGVIVRHHEAGFSHNAMTVFNVPDDRVDACGAQLAGAHGVTLAYRRERAPGWPFNLYCMVHGRDRASVRAAIAIAVARCGLEGLPHATLFSRRRFKQSGARYFSAAASVQPHVSA